MRLATFLALPTLLRPALAYTALSEDSYQHFQVASDEDFNIVQGRLLSPILKPRVPGTEGSREVLQHFVDFFRQNLPDWRVELQNSSKTTPTSNGEQVPFVNLIATRDPPWIEQQSGVGDVGRLVLAAHYDSKLTPHGFVGATDSAAPCAILLHVAQSLEPALANKWARMDAADAALDGSNGVQLLLLDGEEAFHIWNHEDSLYGARALAEEWERTYFPASSTFQTPLHSIELFVLLDLLGDKDPTVPSYFKTTHWAYQKMAAVEQSLRRWSKLDSQKSDRAQPFFTESDKKDADIWMAGMIEDDHMPFLARGVEVLHIIPHPFPRVWHRIEDDGEHLDIATVRDWATIASAFTAEWMDLQGFLDHGKTRAIRGAGEEEKSEL